jgi:hypothetical protein
MLQLMARYVCYCEPRDGAFVTLIKVMASLFAGLFWLLWIAFARAPVAMFGLFGMSALFRGQIVLGIILLAVAVVVQKSIATA